MSRSTSLLRLALAATVALLGACGDDTGASPPPGGADAASACATPCGTACCAAGQVCNAATNTCEQPPCIPDCSGRSCGDNGCGGSCGECRVGTVCGSSGTCETPRDAGEPLDASEPPDAASEPPDAATEPPDASTTPPDAGTIPPDAGTIPPDAGTIPPDAGTIPPDAGTIPPDAGTIPPDAGTIPPDAGTVGPTNDACGGQQALTFTNNVATATGSTAAPGLVNDTSSSCGGGGADVVYTFTTTATQKITATVTPTAGSSTYQPVVYLRRACGDTTTELTAACADTTAAAGQPISAVAGNAAAGTYFVWVDGFSSTSGAFTLEVKLEAPIVPPANDTCAGAQALAFTNNVASVTASTTYAAHDTSGTCGGTTGPDVVYQFTTTAAQKVTATVTPSSGSATFQPVVSIRKVCGSTAGTDELACDSPASAGQAATVTSNNLAAGTYFVWVDGLLGTKGDFTLQVKLEAPVLPPTNDTCAAVQSLTFSGGVATVSGSTKLAAHDAAGSCGGNTGPDVVYQFTTATAQKVTAKVTPTAGSSYQPVVFVRKACSSTASTDEIGCAYGSAAGLPGAVTRYNLAAGTYFVWVDGYGGTSGDYTLEVKAEAPVTAPPANDACGGQQVTFTNDVASFSGQTITATDGGDGTCATSSASPDVVYEFTTTASKSLTIDVRAAASAGAFTPTVFIRKASCGSTAAGDEVFCDSSFTSELTGLVESLPAGTYWMWVEGGSSTDTGEFDATLTLGAPVVAPANDTCSGPTALSFSGNVATVTGDTSAPGAKDDGSQKCGGTGKDLVYQFTTTATQKITATVTPTSAATTYQPVVAIRSPTCTSNTAELGSTCADTSSLAGKPVSVVIPSATAGTFYVWVDGFNYSNGAFTLEVKLETPAPTPLGESCSNPEPLTLSGSSATATGTTVGYASDTQAGCGGQGPDRVYRVTTTSTQKMTVTVTPDASSSTYDPVVSIRSACADSATEKADTCSAGAGKPVTATVASLPAGTYFIWVDSLLGTQGGYTLSVTLTAPVPPPSNDTCASPGVLTLGTPTSGTLVDANSDYSSGTDSAACATNLYSPYDQDVVYSYTETTAATRTLTVTPQSGVDVAVWVTSGATCVASNSSCLYGADQAYSGQAETITFTTAAGTTYYFVVAAWSTPGTFTIKLQ